MDTNSFYNFFKSESDDYEYEIYFEFTGKTRHSKFPFDVVEGRLSIFHKSTEQEVSFEEHFNISKGNLYFGKGQ